MRRKHKAIQDFGALVGDFFHYAALFLIGATVMWTAGAEFFHIIEKGKAELKDILLLFIYLELGVMIGIYFKTHRLPVQFLIFIAITALSRHLVIDVQAVSDTFHLYLLLSICLSILILSAALYILSLTANTFGRPDDSIYESNMSRRLREQLRKQEEAAAAELIAESIKAKQVKASD